MRAPDNTINISEARWLQIKDVCRRVGIDADKAMVDGMPLRAELQRLAAMYANAKDKNSKLPTERQCNDVVKEGLAEIAAFRDQDILKQDAEGHEYRDMIAYFASPGTIKKVLQVLDELENELRSKILAKPIQQSNAAERARDQYWFSLGRLWTKIAPLAVAPLAGRRKSIADFLEATTGASPSAIKNFLDRLPYKASSDADPRYL